MARKHLRNKTIAQIIHDHILQTVKHEQKLCHLQGLAYNKKRAAHNANTN